MESLEMCLPGGLHELGLLEQFKLNTLIHHWRDVVGPFMLVIRALSISNLRKLCSARIIRSGCKRLR